MKKIKNLLRSFLVGIAIGNIIEIFISLLIGDVIFGMDDFIESFSSPVYARLIANIVYGGFGLVSYLSDKLIKSDKFVIANIGHFLSLTAYFIIAGLYLRWFSSLNAILAIGFFILIYAIIWILTFFINKKEIDRINEKINKR